LGRYDQRYFAETFKRLLVQEQSERIRLKLLDLLHELGELDECDNELVQSIDSSYQQPYNIAIPAIDFVLLSGMDDLPEERRITNRMKTQIILDIIKEETAKEYYDTISITQLKELTKIKNIDDDFVDKTIDLLLRNGDIYLPRKGIIRRV